MRDVEAIDVPVAGEAEIDGLDMVRLGDAGWVWTNEKLVAIVAEVRTVVVVQSAQLGRVAREHEVLAVAIQNYHRLIAELE